jgi:hypothetical protein
MQNIHPTIAVFGFIISDSPVKELSDNIYSSAAQILCNTYSKRQIFWRLLFAVPHGANFSLRMCEAL